MRILVTGGTGYIGSHTAVELLKAGYEVSIVDNLVNSDSRVVDRIALLGGGTPSFYRGDCRDAAFLDDVFKKDRIDAVIHFAGYKAVGESCERPTMYYENNVLSTLRLVDAMRENGVKNIVFSSTATVYGEPEKSPVAESARLCPQSPYAASKLMIERILTDVHTAEPDFGVMLLRYFNPAGAHESGLIGENPTGIPNNLMPYICRVAAGQLEHLNVFGNDYPTRDGTGVRDYIHVVDLARGHVCALDRLFSDGGLHIYNLSSGRGESVLEVVHAFEHVNGIKIPLVFTERRAGDTPEYFGDPEAANKELGWKTERTIEDICRDAWEWQSHNPHGYRK